MIIYSQSPYLKERIEWQWQYEKMHYEHFCETNLEIAFVILLKTKTAFWDL